MKPEVLKKIITTVVVVLFVISGANNQVDASDSESLFSLLRKGDSSIRFDDNYKDLILLIGNPGAGKTTLGLLLTANQSDLEAYYDERAYQILIRDNGGRIGADVVKSKTVFPELMLNSDNDAAFYDCPGFRDTRKRNASIDLANTIFIKKIADHARTLKVVMVVNFYSVRKGGSREDFLNLLQSTLKFLKPIEKFVNSTSLIATKVQFVKSPEKTIQTVANFLNDFKESLPDVLPSDDDMRRAKILIDALTVSDNNGYHPKIYFTRVPSHEGLLSNLPDLQSDRLGIGKVIYEQTEYVPVSAADFGYTFSPETETLITRMLDKLESNAAAHLQFLSSQYQQHFQVLLSTNLNQRDLIPAVSAAKLSLKQALEATVINPNVSASSFVKIFMDSMSNATITIGPQASKIIASISDDKKVFALLNHVADLQPKIPQLLVGPIQRSVDFLQDMQDWLILLNEIDNKLNQPAIPTTAEPKLNETDSEEVIQQFVNESSWFLILERLALHCNLGIPLTQDQIVHAIDESVAIAHINLIVKRIIETRWAHAGTTLRKLSSNYGKYFANEESANVRHQLQNIQQFLLEKLVNCENYDMITLADIAMELNSSVMTTIGRPLPVAMSSLESLQNDQQVLNLFLGVTTRKSTTIQACALYQNFEDLNQISAVILAWFDHMDKIASNLAMNNTPDELQGPLFVNVENSNSLLTLFSNHFNLKEPMNPEIPAHVHALRLHLNHMLLQICADSSAGVSNAFDSAVETAKENLRSRISSFGSARAHLTELIQLKSNFSNQREDFLTCSGARNLKRLFNAFRADEVGNETGFTGCGLVELVRSNIPGFCRLDSTATLHPLMEIEALLENTLAWYEFLLALADKLESYPMQRDRYLYNVADVTNWGRKGMPQGIHVSPENCEAFVERVSGTIGTSHGHKAQAMCTTVSQLMGSQSNKTSPLDQLNDLLTLALKILPTCNFDAGTATVKGPYVKLSEALQCVRPGTTQRLAVLATNGFFIDTDFSALESNRGKMLDLIVISPDWTAAFPSTISLNGHDAEGWTHASYYRAGDPGRPGGNGGNFIGLAQNLKGNSFVVSTNGGNGGSGQKGGTGKPGDRGILCDMSCLIDYSAGDTCDGMGSSRVFVTSKYGHRNIEMKRTGESFALEGTRGEPGSGGWDGGQGGLGGNPGFNFLNVFCNNENRIYEKRSSPGRDGLDGAGGEGGQGGLQNEVRVAFTKRQYTSFFPAYILFGPHDEQCYVSSLFVATLETRAPNGPDGMTGRNAYGRQSPPANGFDATKIIRQYSDAFMSEYNTKPDLFKVEQLHAFKKQLQNFNFGGFNESSC